MSTNIDEILPVEDRWWEWSRRHPIGSLALAGFIAVQMATIVGYFLRGIGLPQVPWPLFNGVLFAPKTDYGTAASFFVGQSIHMVDGVVFAIIFAVGLTQVSGKPKETMLNFFEGLSEVMFKFTGYVMVFAPIGVFAAGKARLRPPRSRRRRAAGPRRRGRSARRGQSRTSPR